MFLLFALSIGGTFLVFNRLHFSSQDFPKLAHWIGNDLLRLDEDAPRPWIIGHRGSGLPAKPKDPKPGEDEPVLDEEPLLIGNTERAIREGIAAGVDWIEIDIRATSDLEPRLVVFHDEKIDDKTDDEGTLSELEWEKIKDTNVIVEPSEKILLLDDVFEKFSSHEKWIFDVKEPGLKDPLLTKLNKLIDDGKLQEENVIIFGRRKVLKEYADSEFDLGYTVTWGDKEGFGNRLRALFAPSSVVKRCEDLGARYLVLPIIFSDQDLVTEATAKDIEVWIYDTEESLDHEHAAGRGISGLIVDFPERAIETFQDHPSPEETESE